jgi:Bax protein
MTLKRIAGIFLITAISLTINAQSAVVPRNQLALQQTPSFKDIKDHTKRKDEFIKFMTPRIKAVNEGIMADRKRALELREKHTQDKKLAVADEEWLRGLALNHGVKGFDVSKPDSFEQLLLRVDEIPVSLALAQSACESAWGTSYFARTGNNLFGHMCIKPGCGMALSESIRTNVSEAKKFASAYDAIETYIVNLNSHDAYKDLRKIRGQLRKNSKTIDGVALADGLHKYAEARNYVGYIKTMIREHRLDQVQG